MTDADTDVDVESTVDKDTDTEGKLDGQTFFAFFKDSLYVLFAVFFGLIIWGYSAVYPRNDAGLFSDGGTVDVALDEFSIDGSLVAAAGDVTLNVVNVGTLTHNVVVRESGLRSLDLGVGGNNVVELGELGAGEYELFCSITGHEDSGMVATLTVVEPEPDAESEPEAEPSSS